MRRRHILYEQAKKGEARHPASPTRCDNFKRDPYSPRFFVTILIMEENTKTRLLYASEQLEKYLKQAYRNKEFTKSLLDNLSMLGMQTKHLFSYIEFFKKVTVNHPKDKRLSSIGSAHYFVHESAIDSTTIQLCNVLGKPNQDFGSIHKFRNKNWGAQDLKDKLAYKDGIIEVAQIDRIFTLRSKLIAHVDKDMDFLVSFEDILNYMYVFEKYIKPCVDIIYEEFLNGKQTQSIYEIDFSNNIYNLLFKEN
jgi:hypothetical protein